MVKPGYKQTEIGEIPAEWDTITFKDCFQILPNNTLSRAELNDIEGIVKNIHYGDILVRYNTILNCSKTPIPYVNEPNKCILSNTLLDGDIIISDTAEDETVGKAVEISEVGTQRVVSGLHTIPCRSKATDMFSKGWLGYYINHSIYHEQLLPFVTGTKVSAISKGSISNTVVLIPPRSEQKQIADALSDIDELIESLEKLIAKKKAIKQAAMQELLTGKHRLPGFTGKWIRTKISDLTEVYSGGTPNTSEPSFWNGTIPWMNSGELNLKIVRQVQGRITQKGYDNSSTRFVPAFCVLIGLAGQGKTRGTAAYNTFSLCTNQSIAAIYPNPDKYNSKFLYFLMDTQYDNLRELSSGDGGRGGLTKDLLLNFDLYMPEDVNEQAAIARYLTDIDDEIEFNIKKARKTSQIKQGMMQQLLTGKIRLV